MFARLIALAALVASRGQAADLYVDNLHGDDNRDGRTLVTNAELGGPVRSLTRALELAHVSDRIVLANTGVPYRESVTLSGGRHNGTPLRPFVIAGSGAVLEGSLPVPAKAWEHFRGDVFRFRPPRSAFAQLFLGGPPVERRWLDSTDGRLPRLEPKQWCLADGWIYFRIEEGLLPDDYRLNYAALPVGITLYEVHDVVIEDLTVQGFQLDGINAHDCAKDCELIRVISRGNGRAGIFVGGASNVEIRSSLVSDNGVAQILTEGVSVTSVVETEIDDHSAPGIKHRGSKLFVDGQTRE